MTSGQKWKADLRHQTHAVPAPEPIQTESWEEEESNPPDLRGREPEADLSPVNPAQTFPH